MCVLLTLSFAFAALGQVLPDSVQLRAWYQFNQDYENKWVLRWDEQTGTPASIYGTKSLPYSSLTDPEEIARQFLKDNRAIFRMKSDLSDLTRLRSIESRGVHVLDFQQLYEGISVLGGEYSIAVGPDKAIQMLGGKYYPAVMCNTTPTISPAEALETGYRITGVRPADVRESDVKLVVAPKAGEFFLAYRVWLNQWELVLNAMDGKVIDQFERILRIDGTGNVYPKDPVNSSLTTVTIPRLLGAGTTLDGTYIKATNAESGDAYSASADFRYYPPTYTQHDATHFNDANAYYHTDKFAYQYWPNIGYAVPFKVNVSVHDPYPYGHDNAAASASSLQMWFGHGESVFWDLAKKEDVIYHEYTHIVSGQIGLGYSGEAGALNEGYSDYHAATFTNQHQIGEWATRNYPDLRTLATSQTDFNYSRYNVVSYPLNPAGSPHANSMIWSGALWDLRSALGSTVTDFLVYQGLVYRHGYNTSFLDAREGVITADQNFYGGSHLYTIQHTFYLRGIGADGVPPLSVTMSGPSTVYHPAKGTVNQYTWNANVTGGTPPYTYAWTKNGSPVGTNSSYTEYFSFNGWDCDSYQFTLRVDVTGGGSAYATKTVTAWNSCGGESIAAPGMDAVLMVPPEFSVEQNYPNPFNPETEISFALPEPSSVRIVVTDMLGREIVTVVDREYSAGYQKVTWKGTDGSGNKVGSGVYFCRVVATGQSGKQFMKVMKMALTK